MTTEERLDKVERELTEAKAQSTRAKRRNRWLVTVVGLVVVGLTLAWTWNKITATAQAQQRPRLPIDRNQLETLEEHQAAQNAIELATMKRQCDETFNAAYRAASKAPDEKSALAILDKAKMRAFGLKSSNIRVQNAYSEYLQSTLASQEDRFARLAQALGGADEAVPPPPAPYWRPQHETPEKAVDGTKKTIRANTFIVEDENGKARAMLTMTEDGPVLNLWDAAGKERARLAVTADGPGLILTDENGKGRVVLGVTADGAGLALVDENGKPIWHTP